jgi:hypothetical protein
MILQPSVIDVYAQENIAIHPSCMHKLKHKAWKSAQVIPGVKVEPGSAQNNVQLKANLEASSHMLFS